MSKETEPAAQAGRAVSPVRPGPAEYMAPETRVETMDAIVGLDEAIAALEAMRTHVLAVLGRLSVDQATAERLDTGAAIRDLASALAVRERRSDRAVEAEVRHAIMSRSSRPRA